MSEEEPVFMFEGDDPEILSASRLARKTFKYFWRELSWERRRIVPAIDLAMIKLPFTDGSGNTGKGENMWVDEVDFDGQRLTGVLINAPRWLTKVKEGDAVNVPFAYLEDWLMTSGELAYGGHTVNAMRLKMSEEERDGHDQAWGLDFGDPAQVRLHRHDVKETDGHFDHPMCTNMLASLKENLSGNPGLVVDLDEDGWTMLHRESLAGNLEAVQILVERGADPYVKTKHGLNAIELARALQWEAVASFLESNAD